MIDVFSQFSKPMSSELKKLLTDIGTASFRGVLVITCGLLTWIFIDTRVQINSAIGDVTDKMEEIQRSQQRTTVSIGEVKTEIKSIQKNIDRLDRDKQNKP